MLASLLRRAPASARTGFGIALLFASTSPIAHQDLASLLLKQPGVAERARSFLLSNSLASLRTATFSLPNPVGFSIPRLPVPDHFRLINSALPAREAPLELEPARPAPRRIDRAFKGDRLAPAPNSSVQVSRSRVEPSISEAKRPGFNDLAVQDVERHPITADFAGTIARGIDHMPQAGTVGSAPRLFFGTDERAPRLAFQHAPLSPVERLQLASLSDGSAIIEQRSVAAKGIVTGEGATPKSPAQRLGLSGLARKKAEKCLADAIYFESRSEPERGQIAVAQVVINRVFSGFYPEDICGTVYQNAERHLACQFTFACEGKPLIVNDFDSWAKATRIAREMLDGKLWLNDVGKATHYHAYWVRPRWVSEMRTIQKIGVHTFYRPRKWDEEARVATGG
jgi:spore germination cell wall hydrolase CwlJ-like protein